MGPAICTRLGAVPVELQRLGRPRARRSGACAEIVGVAGQHLLSQVSAQLRSCMAAIWAPGAVELLSAGRSSSKSSGVRGRACGASDLSAHSVWSTRCRTGRIQGPTAGRVVEM